MEAHGQQILLHLRSVADERERQTRDSALGKRVLAVKTYQQRRFSSTYADLLADPRYSGAARFFLDDLYGPQDFRDRDAQFVRIVPALVRLFSQEIVATVGDLAALHALSEALDGDMARSLSQSTPTIEMDSANYVSAWQRTGRRADRFRQIELMLSIGRALDRFTSHLVLRHSLKLMRQPARAAGLAALQQFLERGFATFGRMGGAKEFLGTIAQRERRFAELLFSAQWSPHGNLVPPIGELP
jgi:hypothetical protein